MNYYLLSSYAVFSKLYDAKKSIYELLETFVITYLNESKKYDFDIIEFYYEFNHFFGFNLPQAVLKKTISRVEGIKYNDQQGKYLVDFNKIPQVKNVVFNELNDESEKLFSKLVDYVCSKKNINKEKCDTDQLFSDFIYFLVNNNCRNEQNLQLIATFLIENEDNDSYRKTLNTIKEGIIIYYGITTDLLVKDSVSDVRGSWKTKLTIYLDVEILFHFYGLNGLYYQQQAEDFFALVREINKQEQLIDLRYFTEVEKEMYDFFYAAEMNIETKRLHADSTAMSKLVEGCDTRSQIVLKRTKFFNFLQANRIIKDEFDEYFAEKNYKYNIQSTENDIHPYLNYINILRKGNNTERLRDIKVILITGKIDLLKQSWDPKYYNDGEIPRASSLDYMTEHFWFILNKGFGTKKSLESFDVFNKARIVFSSLISSNVSEKFKELNQKITDGDISEQDATEAVAELKTNSRTPEDIKVEEIDFLLNLLSEKNVNSVIQDNSIRKQKLKENEKTISAQVKTISEQKAMISDLQKYKIIVTMLVLTVYFIIAVGGIFVVVKYLFPILNKEWPPIISNIASIFGIVVPIIPFGCKLIKEIRKKK